MRPKAAYKARASAKQYVRAVIREAWRVLLEPVCDWAFGVSVVSNGAPVHCFARVPFIVSDESELGTLAGTYKGYSKSRRPCTKCLVNFQEGNVCAVGVPRSIRAMKAVCAVALTREPIAEVQHFPQIVARADPDEAKAFSIHLGNNPLWDVPGLDIFANPPCIMHLADHGLAKFMLADIITIARHHRCTSEFNKR